VQYFLVRGDSAETVLQREEALKARLDTLIAAKRISGYQAISNWAPSAKTQAVRRALIEEKLLADGGPLQGIATQAGEDAQWIATTRNGLLAAGSPLTLDDFLKSPASEPWRHLWLGQTEGVYASIVALRGLASAAVPQVLLAAEGLDDVQWVDKVAEISSVLGRYRAYMSWVVLGAYAVVFALLFPRYRGRTWRVLAPTALASIATLALLGFASRTCSCSTSGADAAAGRRRRLRHLHAGASGPPRPHAVAGGRHVGREHDTVLWFVGPQLDPGVAGFRPDHAAGDCAGLAHCSLFWLHQRKQACLKQ
jgi:predicted exporter